MRVEEWTVEDVFVYAQGLLALSVCVPMDMSKEDVEKLVNQKTPAGTTLGWIIASDFTFATGEGNGYRVDCRQGPNRRHWLMEC